MEKHDRILGYFLEEAIEHLNTIEQGLRKLPETVKQPPMIRELFRAAHSIKGSAAMLGLVDVQQVSNQFEANFKLLKEQPQIEVDSHLQSLFLESFGFLRAGIEEVRTSSDPYRQDPHTPDPVGDPVFEELRSYLKQLLVGAAPATSHNRDLERDPAIEQVFGEYVTRKLEALISLCLQPDSLEIRTQIQQICLKLGNLGENFEFLEWTNLFAACRLAIANPSNPLPQLGEIISIAVKQAQVLVLADRHQAIGITPDLEALVGAHRSISTTAPSTWQLDATRDPFAGLDLDHTTQKLIDSVEPIGLSAPFGLQPLNFDTSDNLADSFIFDAVGDDAEALELNEFMNLLSDDMPTEGTWMQDDDFFAPDLLLPDLDLIELATPTATTQTDPPPVVQPMADYDEETFYTPDLGELDDPAIFNFASTTQLAAQNQSLYADRDLLDPADLQIQPNLSTFDLDLPAPDFSLDRPMSELFSTDVSSDALELEPSIATTVPPVELIDLEDLITPDLQSEPTIMATDSLDLFNLAPLSDGINSSTSDVLFLEELNPLQSPAAVVTEDHVIDAATEQTTDELADWIDNSIGQYDIDDLDEFNLDLLNCTEAEISSASIGDDFGDLDLDPLSVEKNHNFPESDSNSFSANSLELNSDLNDDFGDLNLDSLISDIDVSFTPSSDVGALDLDFLSSELELTLDDNFANLDLNDSNINDLELDLPTSSLADLDLDILDSRPDPVTSGSDDFTDLDLDLLSIDDLDLNEPQPAKFEDLAELDFNLDDLSSDIANDQLSDLGSLLDDRSTSDLAEMGDLDALLGVAVDAGSAALIATGTEFADLDALMGDSTPSANPADNLDDLDSLLSTPAPVVNSAPPNVEKKSPDRKSKQSRTFEQTMKVSVRHLDNLSNLVGELVVSRNTLEQDQTRMRQFVEKLLSEVQKLNEVGKRMQDLYERSLMENSLVASRQQHKPTTPTLLPTGSELLDASGVLMEYDPLEMDRFTPIHLLSQKMIELTVRVRESTADIEFVVDGSTEVTRTLRQITGQLQEDLTKSRMLPFAQTADRLQRGVRDNGLKYGKQIELAVEGRDTLIDKVILESLADPLIHMVNNAIAHGIESTEARIALGKNVEGKISIRALHQGNQTIISISDDGAGINTERVKTKAIEKGIITAQQAATMSKAETYDLLFLPSFSTKDQADELSGRGVGMDVVRTSINEIRGTITTDSQLGIGTTFTIRLPLALSITKALIAVNNKNNIAFPMDGIEDTQDVSPEQIQTNSQGEQCIFWRDELMPFKPLSDLLGFNRPLPRNTFYTTNEDDSDLVSILILRSDGNLLAVQVDKIAGDQEIVIKPLQGPASKPLGIAGATVMGDGRIIPIADVMELIALANGTLSRQVSAQWTAEMTAPTIATRESMVLIVDDSITVRELLSLTFKRAGYRVEQARDGQEAWDKLRAGLPCDIVFCDIEMPRMDGLEFLSRVQKDVALSKVPVAMLTSRGSDRHRQIAAQLGASGYFIKPYLEEALLDAAKRMIKGEVLQIV
jgi:chemotaxis protein histidine kinase CheA/ActR/RegA family two-component response regulator